MTIEEVYEKYKDSWLYYFEPGETNITIVLYDLWQAIREHVEEGKP